MFAGVALVAVFGIGVDLLHSLVRGTILEVSVTVVEDGGELFATSVLVAAVLAVSSTPAVAGGAVMSFKTFHVMFWNRRSSLRRPP